MSSSCARPASHLAAALDGLCAPAGRAFPCGLFVMGVLAPQPVSPQAKSVSHSILQRKFPYTLKQSILAMAPALTTLFVFTSFVRFLWLADGRSFLESNSSAAELRMASEVRSKLLIVEIESVLRPGAVTRRLQRMESALAPIFKALPKNVEGHLEQPWAHYALHRVFTGLNGWHIYGLEHEIDGSPALPEQGGEALHRSVAWHLSADIERLFEDRLDGHGFALKDVAVLAAALEHLIYDKASATLQTAYEYLNLSIWGELAEAEFASVLDAYAAMQLFAQITSYPREQARSILASMEEIYPSWGDTRLLMSDLRKMVEYFQGKERNPFRAGRPHRDFDQALQIAETAMRSFGKFQNQADCSPMKDALLEKGDKGTGRIPLSDFYRMHFDSPFLFEESLEALRALGVLDESPGLLEPQIIVPNYLQASVNCLHTPGLFAICCEDECASLMGELEKKIAASSAEPDLISDLVSRLQSSTVDAPRNISDTLLQHLEHVAEQHGGQVPLHGRHFAQWMHHAFPRECAMPHASASPAELAAALTDVSDNASSALAVVFDTVSETQMEEYVRSMAPINNSSAANGSTFTDLFDKWEHLPVEDQALPWKLDEHLPGKRRRQARSPIRDTMRGIVMVIALGSAVVGVARTMGNAIDSVIGDPALLSSSRPLGKIHCV